MLEEHNLRYRTGNECQSESAASMQIKTEGVAAGRENQLRTERRFGESIEHSQESVTVDHPSSSLHSRALSTTQARKNKDLRRSITPKSLAAHLDVLKRELQVLQNVLVSSHYGPKERCHKKRVSFEGPVSEMIYI
ncbi:uncharacterized protein N7511_011238 [Penicillium nucicola]|uniref:uncharacterized protein n=1 Tax=Penicillium nucicola TaxID=1850975 RepID=UPI0025451096|nr:uncharacterized protein N7511_011238 [Penicillium nucicola]KAJ5742667.1 hypothetical protein N7511_011238 [Penicillium nucicola]